MIKGGKGDLPKGKGKGTFGKGDFGGKGTQEFDWSNVTEFYEAPDQIQTLGGGLALAAVGRFPRSTRPIGSLPPFKPKI